ncbi:cation diffusion facilitator family transporter [Nigerium massiliense]|uniref:cation diffusion facilitator family transporter n=1 Tax=Nigerium massiliense TaxID=1522317 RepID=UPI0006942D81|nr:cation diffusion facilitator family transporter [Nigerium massiliense]
MNESTNSQGSGASVAPADEGGASESLLTVLIALGANAVIAVLKSVVAALTGSASMVAEAAHSWADTGNEGFLLIAERRAAKPADRDHPLGYGRAAYVWSMIAAFGLFAVGAGVSIAHGINALSAPEEETDYFWAYVVLAAAFVLEGVSFLQARRQLKAGAEKAEVSPLHYLSHTSNPTLRAVFFEDAAALIGVLIAAAAMALHQVTGNPAWDAIGSILVGVLLGFVAVYLLSRNMAFIVGQVVDPAINRAALTWLVERPEVLHVTYLHLEYVGPQKVFLIGSVDLAGDDPESQAARELEALEDGLEQHPLIAKALLSLAEPGEAPLSPPGR